MNDPDMIAMLRQEIRELKSVIEALQSENHQLAKLLENYIVDGNSNSNPSRAKITLF